MTDNIHILTQHEIDILQNNNNQPVYGTYQKFFESEIRLGNGNKNVQRTIKTLKHESIHEVITELYNWSVSMQFDRLFYSNARLRACL